MVPERKNWLVEHLGPVLVCGFAAAIAAWVAWFITHLPWLGLQEQVSLPAIVVTWIAVLTVVLGRLGQVDFRTSVGAGLVSAVPGLLLLGTRLAQPANASGVSQGLVPSAGIIIAGFLVFAIAIGTVAGLLARLIAPAASGNPTSSGESRLWQARFALVACVAIFPLLLVGGLVTSTNSGMAVPDWPQTYGSNMFLYPLGTRIHEVVGKPYEQVFLEHSHRLFGALVGLTTLVLMVWVLLKDSRKWVKGVAIAAFVLVCFQGVLGGLRVTENSRPFALVHGVLAQLLFALVVSLAVVLSPTFLAGLPVAGSLAIDALQAKRAKVFTAATLHTLILQLLLGAAYRQFRHIHILYTHVALSLVVMVLGAIAGITCGTIAPATGPIGRTVSRVGTWLLVIVVIQFLLGWVAFVAGGRTLTPETDLQAIVRTVHQGNGALLLGLATAAHVWARRLKAAAGQTPLAAPATGFAA